MEGSKRPRNQVVRKTNKSAYGAGGYYALKNGYASDRSRGKFHERKRK